MAAFGVFGLCQIHAFVDYLRSKLNTQQFEVLFKSVISLVGFVLLSVGTVLMLTGKTAHCASAVPRGRCLCLHMSTCMYSVATVAVGLLLKI